jgi:hypothetical protein
MSRLKLRSEKRRPWNLRSPGVSRTGNPLHAVLVGTTKRCRIPPQNLDFNHPAPHAAAQCAAVEKHRLLACRSAALRNHTALKCPVYCANSNVSSRLTDPPHISVPIVLRVFRSRQPISPDLTTLSPHRCIGVFLSCSMQLRESRWRSVCQCTGLSSEMEQPSQGKPAVPSRAIYSKQFLKQLRDVCPGKLPLRWTRYLALP